MSLIGNLQSKEKSKRKTCYPNLQLINHPPTAHKIWYRKVERHYRKLSNVGCFKMAYSMNIKLFGTVNTG